MNAYACGTLTSLQNGWLVPIQVSCLEKVKSTVLVECRAFQTMGRDPIWGRETNWLDKSDIT